MLDFCSQEDEESFLYFHQTRKIRQARIQYLFANKNVIHKEAAHEPEEKAMQLLKQVKTSISSSIGCMEIDQEFLILDFFREQLRDNHKKGDDELLKVANEWIKGEDDGCLEWKLVGKKEFSIRDMERGVKWNKFDEDEQELGLEIENQVLNHLVDEVLFDFLNLDLKRKTEL